MKIIHNSTENKIKIEIHVEDFDIYNAFCVKL